MPGMERLKMFFVSLVAMLVLAPLTGVFLASLHATQGWYVAACIFLSGLAVWRTLAPPNAGIRIPGLRSTSRINPPGR
jgi:hypothetical protein